MDAASLQTLIQLTLFVATLGGLLLNYRKSRSDERSQVHTLLRDDYDRLIKDRDDLRARNAALEKGHEEEAGRDDYILMLEDQIRECNNIIHLRDETIASLQRSLSAFLR